MRGRKGVGGVRCEGSPGCGFCMELTDRETKTHLASPWQLYRINLFCPFVMDDCFSVFWQNFEEVLPGECCLTQLPLRITDMFRVLK